PGGAEGENAEQNRHRGGEDHCRHRGRRVRKPRARHEPDGQVSRDAEVGSVAERDEAAIAGQEVQAEREGRRDEDLRGDSDVEVGRRKRRQKEKRYAERNRDRVPHAARAPKSPCGRTTSAATMGRKRITYASCGKSACPKV